MGTIACVVSRYRVGIRWVHHVEDLQAVFVARYEHIRPAELHIVYEIAPVRGPSPDRSIGDRGWSFEGRLEVEDPHRIVSVIPQTLIFFGIGHDVAAVRRSLDRMPDDHPRNAGDGGQEPRPFRHAHVVDLIASVSRSV